MFFILIFNFYVYFGLNISMCIFVNISFGPYVTLNSGMLELVNKGIYYSGMEPALEELSVLLLLRHHGIIPHGYGPVSTEL